MFAGKTKWSITTDLRESFMIGLLRASNFSAHRHRWKLKFSDNLLLALTKTGIDADFQNLPWGRFYSNFKITKILKMLRKCPQGKFWKLASIPILVRARRRLSENFSFQRCLWAEKLEARKRPIMNDSFNLDMGWRGKTNSNHVCNCLKQFLRTLMIRWFLCWCENKIYFYTNSSRVAQLVLFMCLKIWSDMIICVW